MRLDFMRLNLNCSWINKNISIFFILDAQILGRLDTREEC